MHAIKTLVGLASLAASAAASAASITIPFDITASGDLVKTNWTNAATVGRFDPTLGSLTGVNVGIDWIGNLGGAVENRSAEANTVTMRYGLTLKVRNDANVVLSSAEVATATETKSLLVGGSATFGAYDFKGHFDYATSDAALMDSLFVGTGAIGINVRAEGTGAQTADGPIKSSVNTFAGARGFMTYNYTPAAVPEPGSIAALGLGALALLRRRNGGAK